MSLIAQQRAFAGLLDADEPQADPALLRARAGDEVTVRTPRGPETIEVLAISYPVTG